MVTDTSRRAGPGLSDATSRAIRDAVLTELAAVGLGRLTIDAVARRAGVGKAAVYRRWPSKEEMVLATVAELGVDAALAPDTGSLRGDVDASLRALAAQLRHPVVARIVPDLLAEGARESRFAAAVYDRVGAARRERTGAVVEAAVTRGELGEGVDRELCLDLLAAPLYWRLAVTRQPYGEADHRRMVDVVVAALRAA